MALRNDLIKQDQVGTLFKQFKNSLRVLNTGKHTVTVKDTEKVFKINRDSINSSLNLDAFWTLNGTMYDNSINRRELTKNDTYITEVNGNHYTIAYELDDTDNNDKIYLPSSSALFESGDMSISVWFKPQSTSTTTEWGGILDHRNWIIGYNIASTKLLISFRLDSGSFVSYQPTEDYLNKWTHVVVVYHPDSVGGNGYLKTYVNNVLKDTIDIGSNVIDTTYGTYNLEFGNSSHGGDHHFYGSISDVRIYNEILSTTELSLLYNSGSGLINNVYSNSVVPIMYENLTATPTDHINVFNDNYTFNEPFFDSSNITSGDWDYDLTTKEIQAPDSTGDDLISEVFVNDDNNYTKVTCVLLNENTTFTTNTNLYIIDDNDTAHSINWNGSVTFSASSTLRYKLEHTTTATNYDMFDQYGKPMIMKLKYE